MDEAAETRQLESLREALTLGYGDQPHRAVEQLEALLPEVVDNENKGYILWYEAFFLARIERTAEARERLRQATKLWEPTTEHKARIAVMDAMLDEAVRKAPQALKKLNRIVEEYRALWNTDEARDLYEELQFSRGRLLTKIGDWPLALSILKECLTFDRPKPDKYFYVNLGICYFQDKQWDEAEDALKYALSGELDADWKSAAHYYLGRVYYGHGALAKAMKEFELALSDATAVGTSRKVIYDALSKTSKYLGLDDESARYAQLAKTSEPQSAQRR